MKNRRAFTLIELLVVVLIIGILAAVAVPQYQATVEKSYFAEAATQLKALAQAEQVYFLANGEYTTLWDDLDINFEGELENASTKKHQKNWFLSIQSAKTEGLYYVYAGRQKEYKNGRWYIHFFLPNNTMYCTANNEDSKAKNLCKKFGQETTCPFNANTYKCFVLP